MLTASLSYASFVSSRIELSLYAFVANEEEVLGCLLG